MKRPYFESWHNISYITSSGKQLKQATAYLHRAAQFVAIIGKNLVHQDDDDSNINYGVGRIISQPYGTLGVRIRLIQTGAERYGICASVLRWRTINS